MQSPPISFIRAETRGVFASVFTDFGPNFTVFDTDGTCSKLGSCLWEGMSFSSVYMHERTRPLSLSGEEPHTGIVASISSDQPAMVTCVEDERLEFQVSTHQSRVDLDKGLMAGWILFSRRCLYCHAIKDGELVTFSEVQGLPLLNDHAPIKVKNCKVRGM